MDDDGTNVVYLLHHHLLLNPVFIKILLLVLHLAFLPAMVFEATSLSGISFILS